MPYEVFRKNFFAHMNELEITPGKVRLDEAIRLIVCRMSDFLVPYVISMLAYDWSGNARIRGK